MSELISNAGHANKLSTLATFPHLQLSWKIDLIPAVQQSRYGRKNGLMNKVTNMITYQALTAYVLLIAFLMPFCRFCASSFAEAMSSLR